VTKPIPITHEARDFVVTIGLKYGVPDNDMKQWGWRYVDWLNEHCGQENIDWCMAPALISVAFRIAKKDASAIFAITFPEAELIPNDDLWLRMSTMEPDKVFSPLEYPRDLRLWPSVGAR
jgi:hypothetical protein